jgi:hypothetical protein
MPFFFFLKIYLIFLFFLAKFLIISWVPSVELSSTNSMYKFNFNFLIILSKFIILLFSFNVGSINKFFSVLYD